jgi:hypothetical protein
VRRIPRAHPGAPLGVHLVEAHAEHSLDRLRGPPLPRGHQSQQHLVAEHLVEVAKPRGPQDIGLELAALVQLDVRRAQLRERQPTVSHPVAGYGVFVKSVERKAGLPGVDHQRRILGPPFAVEAEIRPLEGPDLDRLVERDGVQSRGRT